jgi:hypothetical protein
MCEPAPLPANRNARTEPSPRAAVTASASPEPRVPLASLSSRSSATLLFPPWVASLSEHPRAGLVKAETASPRAPQPRPCVCGVFQLRRSAVVLGLPRKQVCVTPNAILGFHNAYVAVEDDYGNTVPVKRDAAGFPVPSVDGTKELTASYPAPIKAWIARHGGLHPWVLYLRMPELGKYMRACA